MVIMICKVLFAFCPIRLLSKETRRRLMPLALLFFVLGVYPESVEGW
jgi:hypothetical protein